MCPSPKDNTTMTRYRIADWEDNGYHDSYFYEWHWDSVTRTFENRMVGATAFGGMLNDDGTPIAPIENIAAATNEDIEACRLDMRAIIATLLRAADTAAMTPGPKDIHKGDHLIVTKACKNKGVHVAAGTKGTVFWSGAFGTFYRNGYNQPNRANTRVGLDIGGDVKVFVKLADCERERTPATDAELAVQAEAMSWAPPITLMSGCKAWLSRNHMPAALAQLKVLPPTPPEPAVLVVMAGDAGDGDMVEQFDGFTG